MVPEGWEECRFGEITRLANGQVDPKVEPYSSMPHVGPENIQSGTGKLSGVKSAAECGVISGKYEFDETAIVYSKIRPNLNKVSKPGYRGICSADMYPIWGIDGVVENNYLLHLMLSDRFVAATTAVSLRTGMPKINRPDLSAIKVQLPPLPEQRKIAEILSTWDRAIETSEALLTTARTQKRALMQTLLTGKRRFPEFEGQERKEVRLGDLGSTFTGLTGKSKEDFGTGLPYIPYLNIFQNSRIDPEQVDYVNVGHKERQNRVEYGDIFFTTSSETPDEVGMSSVLLDDIPDLFLNSFCFGFRLHDFNTLRPRFARFMLRGQEFRRSLRRLAQGATRYNLSKTHLMKLTMVIPPVEEQERIADVLEIAQTDELDLAKQIEKLRIEKKALMQQLLTGKRRVRV